MGEVGTGLGPTLEFYTLLSHAFQESSKNLWRETGTYSGNNGKTYVSVTNGLYPSEECFLVIFKTFKCANFSVMIM